MLHGLGDDVLHLFNVRYVFGDGIHHEVTVEAREIMAQYVDVALRPVLQVAFVAQGSDVVTILPGVLSMMVVSHFWVGIGEGFATNVTGLSHGMPLFVSVIHANGVVNVKSLMDPSHVSFQAGEKLFETLLPLVQSSGSIFAHYFVTVTECLEMRQFCRRLLNFGAWIRRGAGFAIDHVLYLAGVLDPRERFRGSLRQLLSLLLLAVHV